jgi:hypothetical protein
MVHPFRQLTLSLFSQSATERRYSVSTRIQALPARLTDLYREQVPVEVLNVSAAGLGIKVDERFAIGFPVLIECDGLLIVGNIRHCIKASEGGYVLGMKIHKVVDTQDWVQPAMEAPLIVKGAGGW